MHLPVPVEALRLVVRTLVRVEASHCIPSRITRTASSVERSRSVSSTRRMNLPCMRRAYSQLNSAVRTPPMCSRPVGLGAKRVTTVMAGARTAVGGANGTKAGDAARGVMRTAGAYLPAPLSHL